jgi:predicted RNase H-like nuclease (RuvC/YqgF family)
VCDPSELPVWKADVIASQSSTGPEGILNVLDTECDYSANDVAKHISVCIVESPSASSKKISDKPQSLSDSLTTYEDRYRDCLCQNQLINEVNGLKTKISNLQTSINSFETTLKDHDSILYLYGKSTDLNEQYQREIAENKRYINILEQKLFK